MIEIKKGREPDKLLRYRQQNGASYEQTDKEVKEELLGKLLEEQGHDSYVGYVKLVNCSDSLWEAFPSTP